MFKKKKREYKLKKAILDNREAIAVQLRNEWKEAEGTFARQKRKEQLIKFAKDVGVVSAKSLLALLFIGGVLTITAAAPNIFSAFGRLGNNRRYFKKEQFNTNRYYLKKHKLIEFKKIDDNTFEMFLTKEGESKAIETAFKDFKIQKQQKDRYWRVVIFDIPKKYNWARDAFRQKLREMGFYQLQESVFILPYPCEKEVILLAEILNIVNFVHLIKTEDFNNNKELKEIYG